MQMGVTVRRNRFGWKGSNVKYDLVVAQQKGNEIYVGFRSLIGSPRSGFFEMPKNVAAQLAYAILLVGSGINELKIKVDEQSTDSED